MALPKRKAHCLPDTLKFTPTLEHWLAARECCSTQCTLALAVKEKIPGVTYAIFKPNGATLTFGGYHYHFNINAVGLDIITATDTTKKLSQQRLAAFASRINKEVVLKIVDRKIASVRTPDQRAAKVARERGRARKKQEVRTEPARARIAKAMQAEFDQAAVARGTARAAARARA